MRIVSFTGSQPSGAGGRALPALDLGSVLWAQDDGQGGLPALHGDTEDSRCGTRGDPPLASRIVPIAAYCQFGTLPLRRCTKFLFRRYRVRTMSMPFSSR